MSMPQIMPITSYRLIRHITKESVSTPQPTCPDYGLVGDKLMFHSFKLSLGKNKNFIKENLWRCICEWLEFAGMLFLNVSCGQANNILKAIMQQILSKMHQQLRSLAMSTLYAAIYSWCVVGVFDDQVIMAFNQIWCLESVTVVWLDPETNPSPQPDIVLNLTGDPFTWPKTMLLSSKTPSCGEKLSIAADTLDSRPVVTIYRYNFSLV